MLAIIVTLILHINLVIVDIKKCLQKNIEQNNETTIKNIIDKDLIIM